MMVVTIVELEGMPEGSVLQDVEEVIIDGIKCWQGMWCSMMGSYIELVEQADTKEFNGSHY